MDFGSFGRREMNRFRWLIEGVAVLAMLAAGIVEAQGPRGGGPGGRGRGGFGRGWGCRCESCS